MLKIVYPAGTIMERKKEWKYQKFQRLGSIEQDKTVWFKAVRVYLEDLDRLMSENPEIESMTGSATIVPSDAYSA